MYKHLPVVVALSVAAFWCCADSFGQAKASPGFDSLSLEIRGTRQSPARITIMGTGSVEVSAQGRSPKEGFTAQFQLQDTHLRLLAGLLKETDWLGIPPPDLKGQPKTEDATIYSITIVRNSVSCQVDCRDDVLAPYASVVWFARRIETQEALRNQLTNGSAQDRIHACREITSILRAGQGDPVGAIPNIILDYERFVPVFGEVLSTPKERSPEELVAALRFVAYLRLEDQRKKVYDLLHHDDRSVLEAVVEALVQLGGSESVAALKEIFPKYHPAAWGLIQLGPVALPVLVDIIENPETDYGGPYQNLIRAYIDHWKELPGPLDSCIADAVKKNRATSSRAKKIATYEDEFLLLTKSDPPAPGPIIGRIKENSTYFKDLPHRFSWGITREGPARLMTGWYAVVDGKIVEHGEGDSSLSGTGLINLGIAISLADGMLLLKASRTEWPDNGRGQESTLETKIAATGSQELKTKIVATGSQELKTAYHLRNAALTQEPQRLWEGQVLQDGRTVKTITYVIWMTDKEGTVKQFWPATAPLPAAGASATPLHGAEKIAAEAMVHRVDELSSSYRQLKPWETKGSKEELEAFKTTLAACEEVISRFPGSDYAAKMKYRIYSLYHQRRDYQKCEDILATIIKEFPETDHAYMSMLAAALMDKDAGKYEAALNTLKSIPRTSERHYAAQLEIADCLMQTGTAIVKACEVTDTPWDAVIREK